MTKSLSNSINDTFPIISSFNLPISCVDESSHLLFLRIGVELSTFSKLLRWTGGHKLALIGDRGRVVIHSTAQRKDTGDVGVLRLGSFRWRQWVMVYELT